MSQDQITPTAALSDSAVEDTSASTVLAPVARPEPMQAPQKGRRARRASTKERPSKVPNTPGNRSSIYRGVTRHRWTGRYEAHLWDKSCWNQTQNKKGRQVYLGAYDDEEAAARAYDLAALKYWGPGTIINFPLTDYSKELEDMREVSKEEYLASLRRKSSGFSRGVSKYRGVARHHHNGRWEARIGRIFGNKYLYLGTYSTQEEAAAAYDMAAIEYRGLNAVTNFDLSRYIRWLRPGQAASALLPEEDQSGISSTGMQGSFAPGIVPPVTTGHDQMEQTGTWDAAQSCDEAFMQLANASAQSKNTSGSALGLLFQSGIFKQMLDRTSNDGAPERMLSDQASDQSGIFFDHRTSNDGVPEQRLSESNCVQIQSHPMQQEQSMEAHDHVKHELSSFQQEVRHVFDHPDMSLVDDQPEDMAFGTPSNLDRMFFQSDLSFPSLLMNPSPAEMMDQGAALLDSVINSPSLPYAISTCS